jgi:2-oxoglutarate dehydrogenase E2 component (dihydrolipoamide succinyltransferase)
MAVVDIKMPQMGESITEGAIIKWHKKIGEKISKDETLLEISTDKVDSEIPSPVTGVVIELLYPEQKIVNVHTVIARIGTDADAVTVKMEIPSKESDSSRSAGVSSEIPTLGDTHSHIVSKSENRFYSPLVKNIARAEGIPLSELGNLAGTGAHDRITKNDMLEYIARRKKVGSAFPNRVSIEDSSKAPDFEVVNMDTMRKAIAEHMVRSVHTSAHVSSVTEVDVTRIVSFREQQKEQFERREGFKLTFTPFFIKATVQAIRDYPLLNSSVEKDTILIKKEINIGIAVALENGLIVPVIRKADTMNLTGLARVVNDLSSRARNKKLTPDEVQGGTFTITNPGIFGNLFGTPIINQPQVAILGVGAIKKRPVIIDDAIAIRSMVYLGMTYDHRIIDGMLGGLFLERIAKYLENFDLSELSNAG